MDSGQISFLIAFGAGFFSFISPCVLPLVPSYVSFITGLSFEDLTKSRDVARVRWLTISHSLAFIAGFSTVFILFGASATFIGQALLTYQDLIRQVGGILIILFGLYIMGLLKLSFLTRDKKFHIENKPAGYFGTALVGVGFAAAWTPCVGPILGSILLYASTTDSLTQGISLLAVYSLGLGLPFFASALAINTFLVSFKKISRYMGWITFISGLFLVVVGIMVLTDTLTIMTAWLQKHGVGWYVGQ
ncbi:MAG: sulfite exporter TauE/SafE family protein [Nitrospirae bacterium]|nr:sulfite exporter TauE/SafE family protein [Nitrospirota bacterium]